MGRSVRALSDTEIHKILVERIDEHRQGIGIVVGIIEPNGRRIVSYGSMKKDEAHAIDGDAVFEIGSITKVFTALLLVNMVDRGEVALTDPVATYLPSGTQVPERDGKQIVLQDLATHTSGLPREASNYAYPSDWSYPLIDYSVDDLYEFLSGFALTRDIGSRYEYSNVGVALLGHALARRAGTDYEAILKRRILEPLGMYDTGISLTAAMKARLATGYGSTRSGIAAVPGINDDAFGCAGSLRSTANDMLRFLAAALSYVETPITRNLASMLQVQLPVGPENRILRDDDLSPLSQLERRFVTTRAALGWFVSVQPGNLASHDGATAGFRSFAGYDLDARVGVVVLSNAGYTLGIGDIGLHLLNPRHPLLRPVKGRNKVSLDPALLELYVGRYHFADINDVWTIRREGSRMFGSHPGDPENEIFAENENTFIFTVMMVVVVQIVFIRETDGPASELICRMEGVPDRHAKRIN